MPSAEAESQNAPITKRAKLSREDQGDLDAINSSTDRMRSYIGSDPYVLTIPQDIEPRYHHSYQYQAMQWLHNTPFRYSDGEWMQYQTFFYHEHGTDMYVLHNSLPKSERQDVASKPQPATGANTPSAGPKKKISLGAYKKKLSGGTPVPEGKADKIRDVPVPSKQLAVKGPVERVKAETDEVLAALADAEVETAPPEAAQKELKRKRNDQEESSQRATEAKTESSENEPAKKKARTASPPPAPKKAEIEPVIVPEPLKSPVKAELATETALPPKLSPLDLPPLPTRLSPTIPANIADTLKARAHLRSSSSDRSAPNSTSKNGTLTPIKEAEAIMKRKSPVPRNGFRANSSSPALRSDAEDRGRPVTSAPQRHLTPELSQGDEIAVRKALKVKQQTKSSSMVKLKYKKHQRDAVRRILHMRSKPEKTTAPHSTTLADDAAPERPAVKTTRERRDTNAKGVAQKVGPVMNGATRKTEDKRSAAEKRLPSGEPENAEPPTKRQKRLPDPIDSTKDPSTPAQPELQSPALPLSTQKSQQVTPSVRRDHLSVAMQREMSSDSHKMSTPTAQSSTPPANSQVSQPNGVQKAPSSQPSNKTPLQQAWGDEQRRLEALGRELKHAATAHLQSLSIVHSDPAGPLKEQKLAATKCLESLLAYLLAFKSADEAAFAADPKQNASTKPWRSLHGFFSFVKHNCEPFPVLAGLAAVLGVVFNARILEITAQHPTEGPSRDTLIETNAMLLRAAVDAEAKLDVDKYQEVFPRSWEQRLKGPLSAEKLRPGQLGGQYKLPMGVQTAPLQAARAGLAMLAEWIQNEGMEYELKLKL